MKNKKKCHQKNFSNKTKCDLISFCSISLVFSFDIFVVCVSLVDYCSVNRLISFVFWMTYSVYIIHSDIFILCVWYAWNHWVIIVSLWFPVFFCKHISASAFRFLFFFLHRMALLFKPKLSEIIKWLYFE